MYKTRELYLIKLNHFPVTVDINDADSFQHQSSDRDVN